MSGAPLVSAIIAAYNAADFIGETLETVLGQDWHPLEVIVVDDGSTDDTGQIVREQFPTVEYVRQPNSGPSAARNAAIGRARGEFVAVFDADDLYPPGRLRLQVDYLLAHPTCGAVLGRQEWINPPPGLARDLVFGDLDGIPVGGAATFRRQVLLDVGGYEPSLRRGEDTDLLIRLRERGVAYAVLPDVVLRRRFRPSSLSAAEQRSQQPLLHSLRAKLERERQG